MVTTLTIHYHEAPQDNQYPGIDTKIGVGECFDRTGQVIKRARHTKVKCGYDIYGSGMREVKTTTLIFKFLAHL